MLPRDHRTAARTVSVLGVVAVVVSVVFAPLQDSQVGPLAASLAGLTVVLVAALCVLARWIDEANWLAWTLCPPMTVVAIVVVDLLTDDSSVAAQIFLVFPVLYGASQLRRAGAVVMTAASVAGEVVVVSGLPLARAVTDAGYVTAALVTTAVLLLRGAERQAALVARLERQAAVDPLTGLVTRRVLDEAASSALSGADSDEGTSLVLLDVDEFKSINDVHGHPGGDRVLVELGELLLARTRAGDVVCRMGGDEIAVLMPGCSAEFAHVRAEELRQDVGSHPFLAGAAELPAADLPGVMATCASPRPDETGPGRGPLRVSVSIGVAHASGQAMDLRALYAAADAALYEAKRRGRDRVVATASTLLPVLPVLPGAAGVAATRDVEVGPLDR